MNILCIIPARGGSKGIPRKNIIPVAGKPLIAWSIETALASSTIDRLVVSTDHLSSG
jgi:CMP-N,N'-diacetyllegionaminic acid synthase